MKNFGSHFDITPKNLMAFAAAVLGAIALKGLISQEEMAAYLGVVGAVLACLVPQRKDTP
jgi:hypothetical protein